MKRKNTTLWIQVLKKMAVSRFMFIVALIKCYSAHVCCIFLLAHMTNMQLFNSVISQGLSTHYVHLPSNLQRPSHMFFEMQKKWCLFRVCWGGVQSPNCPTWLMRLRQGVKCRVKQRTLLSRSIVTYWWWDYYHLLSVLIKSPDQILLTTLWIQ